MSVFFVCVFVCFFVCFFCLCFCLFFCLCFCLFFCLFFCLCFCLPSINNMKYHADSRARYKLHWTLNSTEYTSRLATPSNAATKDTQAVTTTKLRLKRLELVRRCVSACYSQHLNVYFVFMKSSMHSHSYISENMFFSFLSLSASLFFYFIFIFVFIPPPFRLQSFSPSSHSSLHSQPSSIHNSSFL